MEAIDLYTKGSILLNQEAIRVNGSDASILVHYWGALSDHYNNMPHQHSFYELCYIINGSGQYIDREQLFHLKKGSLFLSRPGIEHQILSETGLDIIFVAFELVNNNSTSSAIELFNSLAETKVFFIDDSEQTPAVKLWTSLLVMACRPYPILNDCIQGLCASFYSSVIGTFNNQQTNYEENTGLSNYSSLVYQAKLYIHDNLSQSLKLEDVADYIHISSRHLSRIFQDELGQTFSNYVKKERMRKAGILLSDTDLSIKEISGVVGFNTVHYFTSVFSTEMGMPPGEFRKRFKQHL